MEDCAVDCAVEDCAAEDCAAEDCAVESCVVETSAVVVAPVGGGPVVDRATPGSDLAVLGRPDARTVVPGGADAVPLSPGTAATASGNGSRGAPSRTGTGALVNARRSTSTVPRPRPRSGAEVRRAGAVRTGGTGRTTVTFPVAVALTTPGPRGGNAVPGPAPPPKYDTSATTPLTARSGSSTAALKHPRPLGGSSR
ncbi:hypothetical protein [Umezawaea beigongshangensis]|uniref:hypothetical protein n=1 Tax=Umezawaea beigongshangensis TaxID=2780383 RepID=UPI0018F175E7|nr:hypothetical protein [Umezawaea beigongshangensis]